jgi:hypothetical protein
VSGVVEGEVQGGDGEFYERRAARLPDEVPPVLPRRRPARRRVDGSYKAILHDLSLSVTLGASSHSLERRPRCMR